MVIDLTWEMVVLSVISRPASAIVKLGTIAKICKYKKLHERHHFILMAMEVHGALWHDWIVSSRNVFAFSMINNQKFIYPCFFAFNFSSNMLVMLFNVL